MIRAGGGSKSSARHSNSKDS